MKKILREIRTVPSLPKWIQENRAGSRAKFLATRALEADTELEKTGRSCAAYDGLAEEIISRSA